MDHMTVYEFDAGNLSLDFANTMNWHASQHPVEMLTGFPDLISWGEQAGLINSSHVSQLLLLVQAQDKRAEDAYDHAIQLREAIYRIFSSRYSGTPIPPADLEMLNSVLRESLAHRQLAPSQGEFRWEWAPDIDGIHSILWSVAYSAAELLTSEDASRVRECEDDRGCGFLFIDRSKNHSRRWCSMESCGNRAKARRHYSRVQAG